MEPGAQHEHMLPGARLNVFDSLHHTGERFGQGGVFELRVTFQLQKIFLHNARRDDDGFRVSSVQKEQIIADVLLLVFAMKTFPTCTAPNSRPLRDRRHLDRGVRAVDLQRRPLTIRAQKPPAARSFLRDNRV